MKYVVDEIINDIAKLENIETKEIKEININLLPPNIKEGNVVIEGKTYTIDKEEEQKRNNSILEKFKNLNGNGK